MIQSDTVQLELGEQVLQDREVLLALGYKDELELHFFDLLLVDSTESLNLLVKGLLLRIWVATCILKFQKFVGLRSNNYHRHIRCEVFDVGQYGLFRGVDWSFSVRFNTDPEGRLETCTNSHGPADVGLARLRGVDPPHPVPLSAS